MNPGLPSKGPKITCQQLLALERIAFTLQAWGKISKSTFQKRPEHAEAQLTGTEN